MKILVTGADGYIGAQLVPLLRQRGHDVTGLDTGFYRDGWLYGPPPLPSLHKDVRRVTEHDLTGFEAVVQLGELSNDPLGELNPALTYMINYQASVNLARKCRRAGVRRFVYSSSCSIYGIGADGVATEDSATRPQTTYARCKLLVERAVSAMADDAFSPTFLRNATAYGPSPSMRFDLVLNNLAGMAWTARKIRLTSDGSPWRPLVHVLDIGDAIACVLEAPRARVHNEVFNVGCTQENFQIRQIAGIVADTFSGCELTLGSSDGDHRSYRVSFEKITTRLGFRCRRTAALGATQLREIFQQARLSLDTSQFRAFTRLKQIQYLMTTHQVDDHLFWRQADYERRSAPPRHPVAAGQPLP